MKNSTANTPGTTLSARTLRRWAAASVVALILNTLLFLFLPALMHPSPNLSKLTDFVDRIEVIRLQKKERPVRKRRPEKPPAEKPEPTKKPKAPDQIKTPRLTLAFKLNSRLPSLDTDFQLPMTDTVGYSPMINGAVPMQQLDTPINPTVRIPPIYPIRARRKGIEGWVKVGFEVDKQGHVQNLHVLAAKPPDIFEKSVLRCVLKWRFKTGTVEGVPVTTKMETTIRFEME